MTPSVRLGSVRGHLEGVSNVAGIIPARWGSTRLPGKAMALIDGEPLVVHAWRAARACARFERVYVTTDADAIEAAVRAVGGDVLRVDAPCISGTARVARAAALLDARLIVNLQGDMPRVPVSALDTLVDLLERGAPIATLSAPLAPERRADSSVVKVVTDHAGRALYFSRAPIPGDHHVGVYGFQADVLRRLTDLPRTALAATEDLEQLDWLHAGLAVHVARIDAAPLAIDTPLDLERARTAFTPSSLSSQ